MQLVDFVDAFDANMYLNAAVRLGLQYRIFKERGDFFEIYNDEKSLRFNNTSLSVNDCVNSAYLDDKFYILNKFAASPGCKVPKCAVFDLADRAKILAYARQNMPLVVKPNDLYQSIGVFTNVDTDAKLLESLDELEKLGEKLKIGKVLLEQQINAKLHRFIYFNDRLLEVVRKEPASVTGDGWQTIAELIEAVNRTREKVVPGANFKTDERCRKFLGEKYNYRLETRLAPGEKIYLSAIPDFTNGGTITKIPLAQIAEKHRAACLEIYRRCDLPFCGIDVFSDDLADPNSDLTLNEINSSLGIRINYYADLKPSLELPLKILAEHFRLQPERCL